MTVPSQPRRPPELRLPYPLLEYLLELPGDYAKLALRLLQRAQWTPGETPGGVVLDAGEVLISLRSEDVWGAILLDRDVSENGRVSLLRRVLHRLADDGFASLRAAHPRDTRDGTRPGTRRDTPATVVRFQKFRDSLWPANVDATRGPTHDATRGSTRGIGTIPSDDPADPFPASIRAVAVAETPSQARQLWTEISRGLRETLRADLYDRWFAPLEASRSDDELLLRAPNPFHRAFVEDNYRALLEQRLASTAAAFGAARLRLRIEPPLPARASS